MNAQRLSQDFARLDGVPEEHRASISHFYDICARFEPGWSESFADGVIPSVPAWLDWRAAYLDAQYIAEHIALHDRTAYELIREGTPHLAPWGIGFEGESAVVMPGLAVQTSPRPSLPTDQRHAHQLP